jgi:hypothetical protein
VGTIASSRCAPSFVCSWQSAVYSDFHRARNGITACAVVLLYFLLQDKINEALTTALPEYKDKLRPARALLAASRTLDHITYHNEHCNCTYVSALIRAQHQEKQQQ